MLDVNVEDSATGVVATDASMLDFNVEGSVRGVVATDASMLKDDVPLNPCDGTMDT